MQFGRGAAAGPAAAEQQQAGSSGLQHEGTGEATGGEASLDQPREQGDIALLLSYPISDVETEDGGSAVVKVKALVLFDTFLILNTTLPVTLACKLLRRSFQVLPGVRGRSMVVLGGSHRSYAFWAWQEWSWEAPVLRCASI